jgi:putative oxidoreductase
MEPIARIRAIGYAATRVVIGLLFACHGAQKLFGAFDASRIANSPLMILAGVIELFGGLSVALGLFTIPVALLASGLMAVAYFKAHAIRGFWPIENDGELAVLYCFAFLGIAAIGAGQFSLDRARDRGAQRRSAGVSAAVARARNAMPPA